MQTSELAPESEEEGERSEQRGQQMGVKKKTTNPHRAESTNTYVL